MEKGGCRPGQEPQTAQRLCEGSVPAYWEQHFPSPCCFWHIAISPAGIMHFSTQHRNKQVFHAITEVCWTSTRLWGKCIPKEVFKGLEHTAACKILRETSCSVNHSRAKFHSKSAEPFWGQYTICGGAGDAGDLVRAKQNKHYIYNSFTTYQRQ